MTTAESIFGPAAWNYIEPLSGLCTRDNMTEDEVFQRITTGDSPEKLLDEYPFLEAADIQACLAYAHRSLAGEQFFDRIGRAKAS